VLDIAASLSWSDIGQGNVSNPFDDSFAETKVDWFGTITPRIGYAFDRAQIFAKGGLAFGRVSNHFPDDFDYVETKSTRTGWAVGAGVEYAVTNNILLGIEYNYVDLGSDNVNETVIRYDGSYTESFTDHDVDTNFGAVIATLGYKF
jgi:outer membrane immunogenic protein